MSQPTVTKQQLLELLRTSHERNIQRLRALPAEAFERGAYENGWNGRQVLAHITAIEWTYPKLIDVARTPPEPAAPKPAGEAPTRTASGGIDAYNQRSIERYAESTVADLLDQFDANRAKTIEVVSQTDDDLFLAPVKSAGGVRGPLGTVMNYIAVLHVNGHVDDIVAAASR